MQRDSIQNTFRVAIALCLVCSVLVSATAVGLRATQQQKKEEFRQLNILRAAGLYSDDDAKPASELSRIFSTRVTPVVLDLETGRRSEVYQSGARELDPEVARRDEKLHTSLGPDSKAGDDIASIAVRETFTEVYEVREGERLKTLILPIRGYGLWSTLWGFVAIDFSNATADPTSLKVQGLTYYKHGETPGLGGEVDNQRWKDKWNGKLVYDKDWNVLLEVSRNAAGDYQVDALSGATLTSNGVTNMLKYWLGSNGFRRYIQSRLQDTVGASSAAAQHGADESPEPGAGRQPRFRRSEDQLTGMN